MSVARALQRKLRVAKRFRARDIAAPEVAVELDHEVRRRAIRHVPERAHDLIGTAGDECGTQTEVPGHGRMLGTNGAATVEHDKPGAELQTPKFTRPRQTRRAIGFSRKHQPRQ